MTDKQNDVVELKPCPFCGGEPSKSERLDEDLSTHNQVAWKKTGCDDCEIYFDWPDGYDCGTSLEQWNTRSSLTNTTPPAEQIAENANCLAGELDPNTSVLVDEFAFALKEKLARAQEKYGYSDGWMATDWSEECRLKLEEHITKGDPRDVAAYCAFMWHHGWSTKPLSHLQTAPSGDVVEEIAAFLEGDEVKHFGDDWSAMEHKGIAKEPEYDARRPLKRRFAQPFSLDEAADAVRERFTTPQTSDALLREARAILESTKDYVFDLAEGNLKYKDQSPTLQQMAKEDIARIEAHLKATEQ